MVSAERVTESSPLLLKVEEAAHLLGIARTSMFQLLASRQVESVRVGRLRRIPMTCLQEYVDRLRQQGRASESRVEPNALNDDG